MALQYNHTVPVLLPSYLHIYINLHIKYGCGLMRIFLCYAMFTPASDWAATVASECEREI